MDRARRIGAVLLALLVLDVSLTFRNWWPTPFVWWAAEPSIEVAVTLLLLILLRSTGWITAGSTRFLRWVSGLWVVLIVGRYADVTAPALWGRELNFYWDLRFMPDVAGMLMDASGHAIVIGIAALVAVLLVLALLYLVVRWAFVQVLEAVALPPGRLAIGTLAMLGVVLFAMQASGLFGLDLLGDDVRVFPKPVTQVYARQARLVVQAQMRNVPLPPSPQFNASLARLKGADVFLLFIESYGAATFDKPDFVRRLAQPRAAFEAAIHGRGRDVVSAFVESPTFGGSSWFAHITFLAGVRVADPDTNALLMTEHRPTVVTNFVERGYRTVALMPGLWYPWPEASFYGFQDIYDGWRLEYKGPPFGWWDMPDQYTLAKLDEQETSRHPRLPLFAFYPTVTSHTPFSPLPPYQPDWARMLTPHPFDEDQLHRAYSEPPDWFNLGPAYTDTIAYTYRTIEGYLERHASRDYVMILIGDHQAPAIVSGENAPWDVPMHVITNRRDILDDLLAHGFVQGLTPKRPRLGQMQDAVPILLKAMSGN